MDKMVSLEKSQCIGCGVCMQVCPKDCIQMVENDEGFMYPKVNEELCIGCDLCKKTCAVINPSRTKKNFQKAYAVVNLESEIRKKSSSGGVFAAMAMFFISRNGYVYGAKYTSVSVVEHSCATHLTDLYALLGSKYTQSRVWGCFGEIHERLDKSKEVLFVGTPCQVAALYKYLGKTYSNLTTVEIVCHGVPSRKLLAKYIGWHEKNNKATVNSINFRNKKNGWMNYGVEINYDNGGSYLKSHFRDPFMRMFLNEYFLRPSCYECRFKGVEREADITISDFWNVKEYAPEMDDDGGISLVYINSDAGMELLKKIQSKLAIKEIEISPTLYKDSALNVKAKCPVDRQYVIDSMDKLTFMQLERRTTVPYWREHFRRIKYEISKVAKR